MNRLNLDGNRLRISEAVIGDTTACIILSLRNDKIDMVNNGYMRVAIDRWGLIEKVDEAQGIAEINMKSNLSEVEYELVKEPNNDAGRGGGGGRGRGRRRNGGRGRGGRRGPRGGAGGGGGGYG